MKGANAADQEEIKTQLKELKRNMADRKAINDLDARIQTIKIFTVDKNFLEAKIKEVQEDALDKAEYESHIKALKENLADKE